MEGDTSIRFAMVDESCSTSDNSPAPRIFRPMSHKRLALLQKNS